MELKSKTQTTTRSQALLGIQKSDRRFKDRWDDSQVMRWQDRIRGLLNWCEGHRVYRMPNSFSADDHQAGAELANALLYVEALTGMVTDLLDDQPRVWGRLPHAGYGAEKTAGARCGLPVRQPLIMTKKAIEARYRQEYQRNTKMVATPAWRGYVRIAKDGSRLPSADAIYQHQHELRTAYGDDAPGLRYRLPHPHDDRRALNDLITEVQQRLTWSA